MRRVVWCAVVGGLLTNGLNVGLADDGANPFGTPPTAQSAPAAGANYYDALFSEAPAAPAPAATSEPAPPAPSEPSGTAASAPRAGNFTLSRGRQSERLSQNVINAGYEEAPASSETQIEQVAGETFAPSRARPSIQLTDPVQLPITARPAPAPMPAAAPIAGGAPIAAAPAAPARRVAGPSQPAAGAQQPHLTTEWIATSDIRIGRECTCELKISNDGSITARQIELSAQLPSHVRVIQAEPAPAVAQAYLGWTFGELAAGESRTVKLTLLPMQPGEIAAQADVRFTSSVAGRFMVSEPKLKMDITGPSQVMIGDPASQTITISNPGTGIAKAVQVEALIPAGLEHARGSKLLMDLGSLHPGESRSVRLPLAAVRGGAQTVEVRAASDYDLVELASAEIVVVAPELKTQFDGPGLRYLGRQATYTLHVVNDGSVATDNVRVMHKVPNGFKFVKASQPVQFDKSSSMINWFVGELDQAQEAVLEVTFACEEMGDFTHYVRATSEHGTVSDSQVSTRVEGTSSLVMNIRDLEDPVEIGSETQYELKVKNEGSAAASNINVACELPAGVTLVNVESAVRFVTESDLVVFEPIAQLKPGEETTIRMHVKSTVSGNLRIRARLTSESIAEPLIKEELTKFYGE